MNAIRTLFNVFFWMAALLCFATSSDAADTLLDVTLAQGATPAGEICSQSGGSTISGSIYASKECIQSGSTTLGGGQGTFNGEAQAITTTGSFSAQQDLEMHLFATAQAEVASSFGGIYDYQSAANDAFVDQITITGGTPGTLGILQVTLDITGTVQISGNAASDSAFLKITVSSPTGSASTIFTSPTNISAQMIFEVPYIFNDNPKDLKITAEAFAGQKVDPAMGAFSATQTVDFSNTITLTSVQIKGVSNGSVISATGFNYPAAAGDPQPPTAEPPVAELSANPTSGAAPLVVNFDASGSYDLNGKIVKYEWDWNGDGIYDYVSTVGTVQHTYATPGSFNATVRVTDDTGATATTSVAITVLDTTPPAVSMTAPISGSNISGTITVSANASDNVGVASVQFQLDGAKLGGALTAAPYSISWNTATASNGSHTLTAIAKDAAGNSSSASVVVTVRNSSLTDTTPPLISSISMVNITASAATIRWLTNEASDSQVEYGLTKAYGNSTPLDTTKVTSHSQTLTGLVRNTLYHYRVKSRDAAGNLAVSGDRTFRTTRR